MNGEDITETISNAPLQDQAFYINKTGDNSVRIILYKDGTTYAVSVSRREGILDISLNFEESLKGTIRGLLGNFNDNRTDDFIYQNGVQISSDATDEMIHEWGQSCKYI